MGIGLNVGGSVALGVTSVSYAIVSGSKPANLVLPDINGSLYPGQELVVVPGVWANSPTTITHQWQADNNYIQGETGSSYIIQLSDVGKVISVVETAINANGSTSAVSAMTSQVDAAPELKVLTLSASVIPENSVAGTVVGVVQNTTPGATLSLSDDASGRFSLNSSNQIVAGSVSTDYESATSHNITVRETLEYASNGPYLDTNFTITVTNVNEGQIQHFAAMTSTDSIGPNIVTPCAQYYNGKTYVSYQSVNFDIYMAVYNHSTQLFEGPYRVGPGVLTGDTHGMASFAFDNDGYIHCFWGCHVTAVQYARSNAPEDPSAWTLRTSPESNCTYPNIFNFSDGSMMLIYRNGGHLNDWVYRTSTDKGITWSGVTSIIDGGGASANDSWYPRFAKDSAETIHCFFLWNDETNVRGSTSYFVAQRYNVYYIKKPFGGSWQKGNGTSATTPVTFSYAEANLRIRNSGTNGVNVAQCCFDSLNQPYIVFTEGSGTTVNIYFGKIVSGSWVFSIITTTDHTFDDYAIEWVSPNTLRAYCVAGGSSGTLGVNDPNQGDRGGSVKHFVSTDNGTNWSLVETIADVATTGEYFNNIVIPENYREPARLIIPNWLGVPIFNGPWTGKLRMWGGSGYVANEVVYDSDVSAFLARMAVKPSADRQFLYNSFVRHLKATGVWTKLDALWLLAANSQEAACLNLVQNAYNLTPVGSGTFTQDRYYTGDGSTGYLDTGLNLSTATNYTQNSAHFAIWGGVNMQQANSDGGAWNGSNGLLLNVRSTTDTRGGRINQAASASGSGATNSLGFTMINRTGVNSGQFYRNNAQASTFADASTAPVSLNLHLAHVNGLTTFSTRPIGFASIGAGLTATDEKNLWGAVTSWMSSVGAL